MDAPQFSVVIPTLNRAALLPVAMRSVLAQTLDDFELIVVDDGSTDTTSTVVAAFTDPRVRYHAQARSGVSAARNAGAAAARGEFLVFLDDDDELLPDALERYGRAAREHGWDVVSAAWIDVSADRRSWHTSRPARDRRRETQLGVFLPGTVAIRTAVFSATGGYDAELRYGENTAIGWRIREYLAANGGRIGVLDEPLAIRYAGAHRDYDQAKYDSARRVLERHADLLGSDVVGPAAPRKRRSSYLAIAGVSAARLGRRRESFGYILAALGNDPTSPARYRNLLTVARACIEPRRSPRVATGPGNGAASAPPALGTHPKGAIHGVIVTFNRPDSLGRMLEAPATRSLDSLTVVDNAPTPGAAEIVGRAQVGRSRPAAYIPMQENSGPAGGFAAGSTRVLEYALDEDWILFLDDDGVPGGPDAPSRLRDFGVWMLDHGAPVGAVGLVGAQFDRRHGKLLRPLDSDLVGPLSVDYIAGGQNLLVRVDAARKVGVFDPDLFFGFEELDYCLRLGRGGYGLYVDGPTALEERRKAGRLGPSVGTPARRLSVWRRYYSVRNHIVIMRRYVSWPRAMGVTVVYLLARPVVDARRRRSNLVALCAAGARGCLDAWTGRLGRTVEPSSEHAS